MDKKTKKTYAIWQAILITMFVGIIVVSALGCGSGSSPELVDTPTKNEGNTIIETNASTEKAPFTVGDTVEYDGVQITFIGITESQGSSFNTPTDGNVFVLCEFEIVNNSNEEITVSTMLSFEAYCDDYSCNFSLSALMEKNDKNQLDGTIAPGKKMNGIIGYEVPSDWQSLEINYTKDLLFADPITFVATNN